MKKSNGFALLPMVVFLLLFAGVGAFAGDFGAVPAIVAFVIALAVAFAQNRKVSFEQKMIIAAHGVGNDSIVTMIFIFVLAGAFSGIVKAAGGADAAVNFGLSIVPSHLVVVGIFLVGCFISLSMGTSMGTIAALAPIAFGIAEKTSLPMALCVGAVVCGAMFGDNLSMISDTTIAAVKTQGCEMRDKFKQNFFIVLPAAIVTIVLLIILTSNSTYTITGDLSYNFWQIIPYLVVLIGALLGFNVFLVLIAGIVISAVVGLSLGKFDVVGMFGALGEGIEGMYEITVISLIGAAIFALVKENGGIQFIIEHIKKRIHSKKGAELGMAGLSVLVDACTANNTVAIVMAGPIAKEIGDEYEVQPKEAASILDIFTSTVQGIIPYGAQLLSAATLTQISPFEIMPYLYYPVLMGISALLFILLKRSKKAEKESKTASSEETIG